MPADVGQVAPEIDLPEHEGRRSRPSEHQGRPVVLIFHGRLA
jgi:peroxiredoxin